MRRLIFRMAILLVISVPAAAVARHFWPTWDGGYWVASATLLLWFALNRPTTVSKATKAPS